MVLKIAVILLLIAVSSGRDAMPDATDTNFQNDCLLSHNAKRALHNDTPPLSLDATLCAYAKARCYNISQQEMLNAGHAGLQPGYGENLYWGASSVNSTNSMRSCSDAVNLWYAEIQNYNYSNPGWTPTAGHFTQVVWKSTTKVGCDRSYGNGTQWWETYVCCNYQPPGNYINQFPQNVQPLK